MARAWLKQLRAEKHFTQAALAGTAGINVSRYSRIEAGYCDPREDEAKALADALSQPIEFILHGTRPQGPKGLANSAAKTLQEIPSREPAGLPVPVAAAPKGLAAANASLPNETGPKGDDLSDPKNFTLQPPTEALQPGSLASADFKTRLQKHLAFAEKVLHTSKVPPKTWVAWRDFHKEAQNLLRGPEPTPPPATPPRPAPLATPKPASTTKPAPLVPPAAPSLPPRQRAKGNKNLFGFFVEVARELLPPEKTNSLEALATAAKEKQPEIGFMKHFKRLAEAELPSADFAKIAAEAEKRYGA